LTESEEATAPIFAEFKRLAYFEGGDGGQPFKARLADMETKLPPHPGLRKPRCR
jgi:hypothetical protein